MTRYQIGVYEIVCKVNGFRYIGGSRACILNRFSVHKFELRAGKHPNYYLQAAWNKFGEEEFQFKIIKLCAASRVELLEQHFIDFWNSRDKLYNIQPLAMSSIGSQRSRTQREIMSTSAKARCTPEWRAAVSIRATIQHAEGRFGNRATLPKKPKLTEEEHHERRRNGALKRFSNLSEIAKISGRNHWNYGGVGTMLGRKWSKKSRENMRRVAREREARKRVERGNQSN